MEDATNNPFSSPQSDIAADRGFPLQATAIAVIEEVPVPFAGTIRTFKNQTTHFLGMAVAALVLLGLGGLTFIYCNANPRRGEWDSNTFILAVFFLGLTGIQLFMVLFRDCWWMGVVRKEIRRRPAPWVESTARGSEYVRVASILPRSGFLITFGTAAEINDIGLMQLDQTNGQIVLECENHRYRIPRDSLLVCDTGVVQVRGTEYYVVRVICLTEPGPFELCLLRGQTNPWNLLWMFGQRARIRRLAEAILRLPSSSPEIID